ncbi:uncharacterized protein CMU_038730 [Cryptosporidium muris RN66]|uniref:Chorein N-terminal domain-containing protein n=1 Tax=Cryptosporidium muris (strain RN66) TaxID=441375 RepID=B6A9B5_CRYMR|nr:uncharacterized protein CMU_038730 [Cryptosporidium muris RN66]EEA04806.1 hypothetical protein CMU_038730 [Cryptosporidium muris RN66]|eukprot:XP_002139155.1 hypothetical protein [Cryptosporidium muris RN66]
MLETILQRILGRYLEPYVYNLSRENLRLGVLSGNLVLENLRLKENLGDILHLPVSLISGSIGHVSITIPWTSLGYKPLVIKLERIHIIIKPKDYGNIDEESLKNELRQAKSKLIEHKEKLLYEKLLNKENTELNDNESNFNRTEDSNTNLIWRILKKIVANIQIDIEDIHICMIGFQSNVNQTDIHNIVDTNSNEIIIGIMIKSGSLFSTDSFGNRTIDSLNSSESIDPSALFKTIQIKDTSLYIGQFFPLNYMKFETSPSNELPYMLFDIQSILSGDNTLEDMNETKESNLMVSSKYLSLNCKKTNKCMGTWRLEYILRPLILHFNISHSPTNNELSAYLEVKSATTHTVMLRRSHLRPIIISIKRLAEKQAKYRELLLRNSHLVRTDPIALSTVTQDEYIGLYSRKLKISAICNSKDISESINNTDQYSMSTQSITKDGNANNEVLLRNSSSFFGVPVQAFSEEDIARLQLLEDVISVRHLAKWRCKAREAVNRISIEAASRKKNRQISAEPRLASNDSKNIRESAEDNITKSSINSELIYKPCNIESSSNNMSWTQWAISKLLGNKNSKEKEDLHNISYIHDADTEFSGGLITEDEMNVIMTAVTNEKYFEKIETPTKFLLSFGLTYFGITILDDTTNPTNQNAIDKEIFTRENSGTLASAELRKKITDSIPNSSITSKYISLELFEFLVQLRIQSVVDRNDKDTHEWEFSTGIKNLSLYHYEQLILFFNSEIYSEILSTKEDVNNEETGGNILTKSTSVYHIGSLFRSSVRNSLKDNSFREKLKNLRLLEDSSLHLHLCHKVDKRGNTLRLLLKIAPLDVLLTPIFFNEIYSLMNLYESILVIPKIETHLKTNNNSLDILEVEVLESISQEISNCGDLNANQAFNISSFKNTEIYDSTELVQDFWERSENVKEFASTYSLPDFIEFKIQVLSPVFVINSRGIEDHISEVNMSEFKDEIMSLKLILGNCTICTDGVCNRNKLNIKIDLDNTQLKYIKYKSIIRPELETNINEFYKDDTSRRIHHFQEYTKKLSNFSLKWQHEEFVILHPVPVSFDIFIDYNSSNTSNYKGSISLKVDITLQQFIFNLDPESIRYLLHIPFCFYSALVLPTVQGYYFVPSNILKLRDFSSRNSFEQHLSKLPVRSLTRDAKITEIGSSEVYETINKQFESSINQNTEYNGILSLNWDLKCSIHTETVGFAIKSCSQSTQEQILQGSIRGILSKIEYDSTSSILRGKMDLHRVLLFSPITKIPLLFTLTEYDPITQNVSDMWCNIEKRISIQSENLGKNDDLMFVDAIEEYENTIEISFVNYSRIDEVDNDDGDSHSKLILPFQISIVASPIEVYWDKPTIISILSCLHEFKEVIASTIQYNSGIIKKILVSNRFFCYKLESYWQSCLLSTYAKTYFVNDISDYNKIKSMIFLKNSMMTYHVLDNDESKKFMSDIVSEIDNSPSIWLFGIIVMPPMVIAINIKKIQNLLSNISKHLIEDTDNNIDFGNIRDYISDYEECNTNNNSLNRSFITEQYTQSTNEEYPLNKNKLYEYYHNWKLSGLGDLEDFSELPKFSFELNNENSEEPRNPTWSLTCILRGGSLTFVRENESFIIIGIHDIGIAFDGYDTGDKKFYIEVQNCSLTINKRCILSRFYEPSENNRKCLASLSARIYSKPLDNFNEDLINIALKGYLESFCYIVCYRDIMEFIEYINDGILDSLITKSYEAAREITKSRVFLYFFNINNSILMLPEDKSVLKEINNQDIYLNLKSMDVLNQTIHNPLDIFDETVNRYKKTLQQLLEDMYYKANKNLNKQSDSQYINKFDDYLSTKKCEFTINTYDESNLIFDKNKSIDNLDKYEFSYHPSELIKKNSAEDTHTIDHSQKIRISPLFLSRIKDLDTLTLLEKSTLDYPRAKYFLRNADFKSSLNSFCKVSTKQFQIYNQLSPDNIVSKFLRKENLLNKSDIPEFIWNFVVKILNGQLGIVSHPNGSRYIDGNILSNINAEISYGTIKSFPNLCIFEISNPEYYIKPYHETVYLNVNLSPICINLSRQQLTFLIDMISQNFGYKLYKDTTKDDIKHQLVVNSSLEEQNNDSFNEHSSMDSQDASSFIANSTVSINISLPLLSLETSFSHTDHSKEPYRNVALPLVLVQLHNCCITGWVIGSCKTSQNYWKVNIVSQKYFFDDIRLTTNLRYRRIIHSYSLGDAIPSAAILDNEKKNILNSSKCSLQFIWESSTLKGHTLVLKSFNPEVYLGFNAIIDFYYYLSHSWRSSTMARMISSNYSNNEHKDSRENIKENEICELKDEFEIPHKNISSNDLQEISDTSSFSLSIEINKGRFGFTSHPQDKLEISDNLAELSMNNNSDSNSVCSGNNVYTNSPNNACPILIWETDLKCKIVVTSDETLIKYLDLLNSTVRYTDILTENGDISEDKYKDCDPNINNLSTMLHERCLCNHPIPLLLEPLYQIYGKYSQNIPFAPINFQTPKYSLESKKSIILAETFSITSKGSYTSNIRNLPDLFSIPVSLSEIQYCFNFCPIIINIPPSHLVEITSLVKNLFDDGPSISPLYTSTVDFQNELHSVDNWLNNSNEEEEEEDDLNSNINILPKNKLAQLPTVNLSLGPPPIRRIFELKFSMESLRFLLLDDQKPTLVPILDIKVRTSLWKLETTPIKTNHTINDLDLLVDVLNFKTGDWEPVIEKCKLSIHYFQENPILYDPYAKPLRRSLRKYLHIASSRALWLNIKPTLCYTLNWFIPYCFSFFKTTSETQMANNSECYSRPFDRLSIVDNETKSNELRNRNNSSIFVIPLEKLTKSLKNKNLNRIIPIERLKFANLDSNLKENKEQYELPQLMYLNLTGLPFYAFTISFNGEKDRNITYLNSLVLLSPSSISTNLNFLLSNTKLSTLRTSNISDFTSCSFVTAQWPIKMKENCICLLSAPVNEDIYKLSKQFPQLEIELIARVLCIYKSFEKSIEILTSYTEIQSEKLNPRFGPLPSGIKCIYFNAEQVSSALLPTITPNYSKQDQTLENLLKDKIEDKERGSEEHNKLNNKTNHVLAEILSPHPSSKLLCLLSSNRIVNKTGIPLEICFLDTNNIPIKMYDVAMISTNMENANLIFNEEILHHSRELIGNNGMNIHTDYMSNINKVNTNSLDDNLNNINSAFLDQFSQNMEDVIKHLKKQDEISSKYKFTRKINDRDFLNDIIPKLYKSTENKEEIALDLNNFPGCDEFMNKESKPIPSWLGNTDTVNTIISSIHDEYNKSCSDPRIMFECENFKDFDNLNLNNINFPERKYYYYSYFLPNEFVLSVPQVALISPGKNKCKVLYRPALIGLVEMFCIIRQLETIQNEIITNNTTEETMNRQIDGIVDINLSNSSEEIFATNVIYNEQNTQNFYEYLLSNEGLACIYSKLMSSRLSETTDNISEELHSITYKLLRIFKICNGNSIFIQYYNFWNYMIQQFFDSDRNVLDLSCLSLRGWISNPIDTGKNINKTIFHKLSVNSFINRKLKNKNKTFKIWSRTSSKLSHLNTNTIIGSDTSNLDNMCNSSINDYNVLFADGEILDSGISYKQSNSMSLSDKNFTSQPLYFQSYIQLYKSIYPGEVTIRNLLLYPSYLLMNFIPTLLECQIKCWYSNSSLKTSKYFYSMQPFQSYALYELPSSKSQIKVRIALDNSLLDDRLNHFSYSTQADKSFTIWSSSFDAFGSSSTQLNLTSSSTSCDMSSIDLECVQIDKLQNRKYSCKCIGYMQKHVLAFNSQRWFINKTNHSFIPLDDNKAFPIINVKLSHFYNHDILKNRDKESQIALLNTKHSYLQICFQPNLNRTTNKWKVQSKDTESSLSYSNFKIVKNEPLRLGLIEIPPIESSYSFPIFINSEFNQKLELNESKNIKTKTRSKRGMEESLSTRSSFIQIYYFTIRTNTLKLNNIAGCTTKIVTVLPNIIIDNKTNEGFYWLAFYIQNSSSNTSGPSSMSDLVHNFLDEIKNKTNEKLNIFSIEPFTTEHIVAYSKVDQESSVHSSNLISGNPLSLFGSSEVIQNLNNQTSNNGINVSGDQKIILFLSGIDNEQDNNEKNGVFNSKKQLTSDSIDDLNINDKVSRNEDEKIEINQYCARWSQPIVISSESAGIYYMTFPNVASGSNLVNPKTYCIKIISDNGVFVVRIKNTDTYNPWSGVVFTNHCSYLPCITLETFHYEYKNSKDESHSKLEALYSIFDRSPKPLTIGWPSPFLYTSRNCKLYIIPESSIDNNSSDQISSEDKLVKNHKRLLSKGIIAFEVNFHYSQTNPYQYKRYILSLPEQDILKLCSMYPYLNSAYFLNNDNKKMSSDHYPIAVICIVARDNGVYVDVLPPRNQASLVINLLTSSNVNITDSSYENESKNLNVTLPGQKLILPKLFQKLMHRVNKYTNDKIWLLTCIWHKRLIIDIAQIGISMISERRESEILYLELSAIQFRKQEKSRNGMIESYRFIIGDIQLDNQYTFGNPKSGLNSPVSTNKSNNTGYNNNNNLGLIPFVLLNNRTCWDEENQNYNPFMILKWFCSTARSRWETIVYSLEGEFSDLELNFDFTVYKIISEFIDDCKMGIAENIPGINFGYIFSDNILSKITPNISFNIEKIKLSSLTLHVWCSIPLDELQYIPEWFRIGLRILTVSNSLELRGAPIHLESHNLNNTIGNTSSIVKAFYEYYMAEILWRIGTVLGHSSFVNIPLVPLQLGKNTLNVAFSTISAVNSSLTNLLSNLTMDSEYINARQRELYSTQSLSRLNSSSNQYPTASLKEGFSLAGQNITQGLLSLRNIVTKPIEGAQRAGFTGFCTGLIKGVTSSIIKPIDHIGQALNNVIDGIQAEVNKPLGGYKQRTCRRRIPRLLWGKWAGIVPYNSQDALLRNILGYKLMRHVIYYFIIPTNKYGIPLLLLCYPQKIILVKLLTKINPTDNNFNNTGLILKDYFKILWVVHTNQVKSVRPSSHGILIYTNSNEVGDLQIPTCSYKQISGITSAIDNILNFSSSCLILR